MAEEQGGMVWKVGTALFAVLAIGATVCAYQRNNDAQSLRQQLVAATADAKGAHDEASSLKTQLAAAQTQANSEQQQLAATQQQASTEQQQLADAQQKQAATDSRLVAALRPDLPIVLSFHRALVYQGDVAVIRNTSSRTLDVILDVRSQTGTHFRRELVINPGPAKEFGAHEGWAFASGQVVTLSNPGYRPLTKPVGG